jgi:hypothetical protein
MCIYSHFQYLCLHEKLKIQRPCNKATTDSQGVVTCPNTSNVQNIDFTHRTYAQRTYGVGLCSNIHCAWNHSILPFGDYGNNKKFGKSTSFEDDTEIDDSPAAREERVSRWFRLLSADQQLDHLKTGYPLPDHERSVAGHALLNFPHGADMFEDQRTLHWQELNPLYLTPAMLQWCVFDRLLPASIADNRKSMTITPHKPIQGPFSSGLHKCPKKRGICKVCGERISNNKLKEKTLSYRQSMALTNLWNEDRLKEDPTGSAFDPNLELKWDDEKGDYVKVPANVPVSIYDAPYPSSSNISFVPSTTQAIDTAAIFGGQDLSLANGGYNTGMADDLTGGMDWESFVQDGSLENFSMTSRSAPFTSTNPTGLPVMPQAGLDFNNFSSNADFSFGADLGTAASIDTGTQAGFDFGLPETDFNTFEFNSEPISSATSTKADPLHGALSGIIDPADQAPHDVSSDSIDDPMSGCAIGGDDLSLQNLVGEFFIDHEIMDHHYSAETLNLVHQMLRQAFNGAVAGPSYDPAADALFEQVLQYKRAGQPGLA